MECQMLTTLNFHIVVPTVVHFTDRLQQMNACDAPQKELINYLVELALPEIHAIRCCFALWPTEKTLGKEHEE